MRRVGVYNLYFKDCHNDERIVKTNIQEDEVGATIVDYVRKLNPNFKIYYTRSWMNNSGDTVYDVGSHTEFFILRKM